ncbi:MAG TPA: MFS transporter [Salinisphaeraceae bacterium]|nr:MFS transporter [Salinisphaeraceae bacterium]
MATADATAASRSAEILARLNRIPVWSLPRYYLVVIGLGYFFTFYDITDIGFAMPAIADQFGLAGSWRILFFIGGAIAVAGLVLRTRLPESPRWQVGHGFEDGSYGTPATMDSLAMHPN